MPTYLVLDGDNVIQHTINRDAASVLATERANAYKPEHRHRVRLLEATDLVVKHKDNNPEFDLLADDVEALADAWQQLVGDLDSGVHDPMAFNAAMNLFREVERAMGKALDLEDDTDATSIERLIDRLDYIGEAIMQHLIGPSYSLSAKCRAKRAAASCN